MLLLEMAKVVAEDAGLTVGNRAFTIERLEQGALARADLAYDVDEIVFVDLEVHMLEDDIVVLLELYVFIFDEHDNGMWEWMG